MDQTGPKRSAPVAEVRILRLAAGGDGIGRLPDGMAVFVPRTAPGDLVEIDGLREHKRFARGRVSRIVERSAHRVEPRCPHYTIDECGGCQLQHLEYPVQLESRAGFVGDALRRLGHRESPDPAIVPSDKVYDYRTKITLHVSPDGHRIGLHRYERPDQVFELVWCHITEPELMALWQILRNLRQLFPPRLGQIVLRLDRHRSRHLVFRVGRGEAWSGAARLFRELKRHEVEATIWWQPEGGAARAMAGAGQAYPATVFEQVHPGMGDRVREFALRELGQVAGRRVWDLYSGIGETTEQLVRQGARVESVELDRRAVEEAESRGLPARRHTGRVEDLLGELKTPELVVANPPRAGMDRRVPAELERIRPRRVVYISCDPATLARDLQRLPDFRIAAIRAFDLFPQTTHVETVAVLEPA